jgi:putative pyruvate formate lyase activating enzyme
LGEKNAKGIGRKSLRGIAFYKFWGNSTNFLALHAAFKLSKITAVMEKLSDKILQADQLLAGCTLCPRNCGINRLSGETGFCLSGAKLKIASALLHFGEEPPISGPQGEARRQKSGHASPRRGGSGTIFFSNCNLACAFCQNYEISQEGSGREISEEKLADIMLDLAAQGTYNINLVSPTHFGPQILKTLVIAREKGLKLPIVYNSNGYDGLKMLQLFDGLIDIYMPDMKYGNEAPAQKYSKAPGSKDHRTQPYVVTNHAQPYVAAAKAAITEMFKQVGPLKLDKNGLARHGLLVRHLILPGRQAGSFAALDFLAGLSTKIWLSLMSQYYPAYRAAESAEINRPITAKEYQEVVDYALDLGFENILGQDLSSQKNYRPDFKKKVVFL